MNPFCPHCQKTAKSKVVETRTYDGVVYRRRLCACGESHVTSEQPTCNLKFPSAYNRARKTKRITDRSGVPGSYLGWKPKETFNEQVAVEHGHPERQDDPRAEQGPGADE